MLQWEHAVLVSLLDKESLNCYPACLPPPTGHISNLQPSQSVHFSSVVVLGVRCSAIAVVLILDGKLPTCFLPGTSLLSVSRCDDVMTVCPVSVCLSYICV